MTDPTHRDLLVKIRGLSFRRGARLIFDDLDLDIRRGSVTAVMGPSGSGKTTLLKLITGQLHPDAGRVEVDGEDVHRLDKAGLFRLRRRMGMLFQSGALLTDLTVFENVAYPLREHTDLSPSMLRKLVLLKLEAVGLRGARDLMPNELSGGMARRVALARAIALDPMMILFDEPFTGQDPISMGMLVALIRQLNDAAGLTSILVSHDVRETASIADYLYVISEGRIIGARNAGGDCRGSLGMGPSVHGRTAGWADALPLPRPLAGRGLPPARNRLMRLDGLARLGRGGLGALERLGRAHLLLASIVLGVGEILRRPGLLWAQVFNIGVLSLLIIGVSGLFVGMVLGLQGYYVLARFGAEQSLGVMVASSLVRELGPVVTALLVAGRAGSALTAEIGLMKATEQLSGLEMMAVDPVRRILTPRFFAGVVAMPMLAALFSAVGVIGGYFVGVGLLGVDDGAFWSQMQAKVDFEEDLVNGVIKSLVFGVVVTWIALFQGYDSLPTAEGVSSSTTRSVVHAALVVLGVDFVLTALMFGD